jgi:transcriptional regulator with XRE-family HTH domain
MASIVAMASIETGRDRLAAWIQRSKLKQVEAADIIGMDQTQVSLILNGKRRPSLDNAVKIERATGIPVHVWAASPIVDEASDETSPVDSRA